jgi:uncharacterized protein VirK/YbjX
MLTRALIRHPLIYGAIFWPYMSRKWPLKRRLASIDQHYRMLDGPAAIITHATFQDVELAQFDEDVPGLRLVLDKAEWFIREGEIVLNLFIEDRRIYSIAFTLGIDVDQPLAYVGALQGSNSRDALEVYRSITRALHGMRPRDVLLTALKLLCGELKIPRIWAVCRDDLVHNSPYFGDSHKDKILADLDQVWLEHGGTALDNGFIEIPVVVKYRDVEDIPSRKRAAYRRRYRMLDRLALDIKRATDQHASRESAGSPQL